jgi:membrane protein CcdC involved in cytochrome C biogenesis
LNKRLLTILVGLVFGAIALTLFLTTPPGLHSQTGMVYIFLLAMMVSAMIAIWRGRV